MKNNRLTIQINKPAKNVFHFLLNPQNTPLWINTIVVEETNEWPAKLGTIYRNKNKQGLWQEYKVTTFEENKRFEFTSLNSTYHVRYTFRSLNHDSLELEYYEWVEEGGLDEPFMITILQKLKSVVES